MPICCSCGEYYRMSQFHTDNYDCQNCSNVILKPYIPEEESDVDIRIMINPSGKTAAHIEDDA